MRYYIDADAVSLEDLQIRIETTDLVPSRMVLLRGVGDRMDVLRRQGLANVADLRNALKTKKKLESLARAADIDETYLVLLRREVESYFPRPFPLRSFEWLPRQEIGKCEQAGAKNTIQFYSLWHDPEKWAIFKQSHPIDEQVLDALCCLCDLVRMQWTNPVAARMYIDAGYDAVHKIASADPETLHAALVTVNKNHLYFKGNIGLRDIKRLVNSARYL